MVPCVTALLGVRNWDCLFRTGLGRTHGFQSVGLGRRFGGDVALSCSRLGSDTVQHSRDREGEAMNGGRGRPRGWGKDFRPGVAEDVDCGDPFPGLAPWADYLRPVGGLKRSVRSVSDSGPGAIRRRRRTRRRKTIVLVTAGLEQSAIWECRMPNGEEMKGSGDQERGRDGGT